CIALTIALARNAVPIVVRFIRTGWQCRTRQSLHCYSTGLGAVRNGVPLCVLVSPSSLAVACSHALGFDERPARLFVTAARRRAQVVNAVAHVEARVLDPP